MHGNLYKIINHIVFVSKKLGRVSKRSKRTRERIKPCKPSAINVVYRELYVQILRKTDGKAGVRVVNCERKAAIFSSFFLGEKVAITLGV